MNILVLIGSSRKNGNSSNIFEYLKNHELSNKYTIEGVYISDYKIENCKSCYMCDKGTCVIDDDMPKIVDKMLKADAIIYLPVVYAFSTNSIMQKFLERCGFGFLRTKGRPLKDKLANVIAVGRRYAHLSVISQIFMNIYLNEMIILGSGFPLVVMCDGDFPGDAMLDEEGKNSINRCITRMVEYYYEKRQAVV
ncbi:flavodoxin family protein [Ruminiclostridium herbifermentans]|uniref:Flavodoxin family protein n=1 Tax=Ruminiclostridium herbifermentans TaxID=2488810 RepID=A0A4U7JJX6_9FIRM|nr:flavodoxin family protein [Ruminiclostridium herbifermentans]QNU66263.1 flavodoxin family protein [Ruminiclostridium herbifermentans]